MTILYIPLYILYIQRYTSCNGDIVDFNEVNVNDLFNFKEK